MAHIIVTLTDVNKSFMYDLELPIDLEYEKLFDDIIQTIISYNPDLHYQTMNSKLIVPKLMMKEMQSGQTLESIGVFNGDYLLIS